MDKLEAKVECLKLAVAVSARQVNHVPNSIVEISTVFYNHIIDAKPESEATPVAVAQPAKQKGKAKGEKDNPFD